MNIPKNAPLLSTAERMRKSRKRKIENTSAHDRILNDQKEAERKKSAAERKRKSRKRKMENMSAQDQINNNEKETKRKKSFKNKQKETKIACAKGLIEHEKDWLLTSQFVIDETKPSVSDSKDRDENGYHYLGPMNHKCEFCGGLGFRSELVGKIKKGNKFYANFGSLCCSGGKVKGIHEYDLPEELEHLFTSQENDCIFFRDNAQIINNGMAMCSLTSKYGWKKRTHSNKSECMLTSQGQLLRRIGPLIPKNGEPPKCIQTYFYGGTDATKWRLQNVKKAMRESEKKMYTRIFDKAHNILINANNKYIKSFQGVKDYVEKHLKDKCLDVKLVIHANKSDSKVTHKGRLNGPTIDEIAILIPDDSVITKDHNR